MVSVTKNLLAEFPYGSSRRVRVGFIEFPPLTRYIVSCKLVVTSFLQPFVEKRRKYVVNCEMFRQSTTIE